MGAVTLLTAEEFLNMLETPGKHELLDGDGSLYLSRNADIISSVDLFGGYLRPFSTTHAFGPWRGIASAGAGSYRMLSVNWPDQL
jgi:hypothetical protein